jgi:hypothetical protein|nr:ATP-binding protein [Kofleriaceae bacterium]
MVRATHDDPGTSFTPRPSRDDASTATHELVLSRVRLRAGRRARWLRGMWADAPARGRSTISHVDADALLADADAPEREARAFADDGAFSDARAHLADVESALAADARSRLARLARTFDVTARERDWLEVCLAIALDPAIAPLCAYLQDHAARGYVTEPLVARLYQHGRSSPLSAASALVRWQLVVERDVAAGEPREVSLDPAIRDWLLGTSALDDELAAIARIVEPLEPLATWPVTTTADAITRMLAARTVARVRVAGLAGSGRRTFAACVGARAGVPVLAIDADAVADAAWPRVFVRVQRQAFLGRIAPVWYGERAARRAWPDTVARFPIQFVIGAEPPPPGAAICDHAVELPEATIEDRVALWRAALPDAVAWPDGELAGLASQHRASAADIALAARAQPATAGDAAARVRAASAHRLGELAQPLDAAFAWDDLVVPPAVRTALAEFAFEARTRAAFWQGPAAQRLFPHGRGLLGLLCGPPGTGKTMSAQVIARELGLGLFRIDLSTVVSKWVGETSKNLASILARAAHMDVVLLFDEADALFARRTEVRDAHDRFANTDTNYLLQAVEGYRGIALLATNRRSSIDPAFVRRVRTVIEFPAPGAAERREIWSRLVGELSGADAATRLAADVDQLAQVVEVTGAQIKQAVLTAQFAARRDGSPLARAHLVRGLERELGKDGRTLDARAREPHGR